MTETPGTASGLDMARQALAQARAAAKTAPAVRKKTARVRRADRGNGRDPVGLGGVLGQINVDHEWNIALGGASLMDRWLELCPQFAGRAAAVAFDQQTGCLDVRPAADGYGASIRLMRTQLIQQINAKLGKQIVRHIRVLPVGSIGSAPVADVDRAPAPAAEPGPVRTRETASRGYQLARAAYLEHKPTRDTTVTQAVKDAVTRQNEALSHPARREPETEFTDAVAELERVTTPDDPRDRADAVSRAAIHQKQTGGNDTIQTAFRRTA